MKDFSPGTRGAAIARRNNQVQRRGTIMPQNTRKRGPWVILPAVLLGVAAIASYTPVLGQDAPPATPTQEPQVLTRGPIHEGFAEPVSFNPKPGLVAPKEPPPPVEEIPPEDKPAGENVAWLAGYWSW